MAKILLVDDDEVLTAVMQERLTMAGHQVCAVHDPRLAAEAVAREKPDLAIVDFLMPGMSGTELLATLRAAPGTKGLPVILLSSQQPMRVSAGVPPDPRTMFLDKPVDHARLGAAIAALLDPDGWSQSSG